MSGRPRPLAWWRILRWHVPKQTVGGDAAVSWRVHAPAAQVETRLRAAARRAGLALELGPDQVLAGALCGWAYAGNGTGNPIGRLDVAEVRLIQTANRGPSKEPFWLS